MRCEIRRLQSLHAALQYCLNWNQRITSGCITVIATGHEQTPLRMKNQARDCILNFTLWLRSTEAPGMQTLQRSNSVTKDDNNGDNPSLMKDSWFDSDSAFFLQTVDWYNLIYCNTFSVESAWEAFPATLLTAIDQHVVRIVKVNNRGKKYYPPGVCKCVIKKGMLGNHSNPTVIVVYRQQYYGCIGRLSTGCQDYISKLTAKRQVVQLSGVARGGQDGRSPPPKKKHTRTFIHFNIWCRQWRQFCRQWRLKPSASKTISSVFHLHNTSATRELSVVLYACFWHS